MRDRGARTAVAAGGAAIVLWSLNATLAGVALESLAVSQVLAAEFGGAWLAIAGAEVVRRRGRPLAPDRSGVRLGVIGVAGTIGLQYVAFATAPLVAANAIAYAWPMLAAVRAARDSRAGGGAGGVALAAVGFAGVVLLLVARGGDGGGGAPVVGYLAAAASAVAMAYYTAQAGRSRASTRAVLLSGTAAGTLVALPIAVLGGRPWAPVGAVALAAGIGVAMLAVGYGLWTVAMRTAAGPRLAPAAYLTPLLSTAVLLLTGRHINIIGLAGCALIVACASGVMLLELRAVGERRTGGCVGTSASAPGAGVRARLTSAAGVRRESIEQGRRDGARKGGEPPPSMRGRRGRGVNL